MNDFFAIPLATSGSVTSEEKFWDAILLYHNRPHLVNRKITAVSQVLFYEVIFKSNSSVQLQDLLNRSAILYELRQLCDIDAGNITCEFLKKLLEPYDTKLQLIETSVDSLKEYSKRIFVSVRILFPRMKNSPKGIEVVTFDRGQNRISFLAVSDTEKLLIAPPFPYELELNHSQALRININSFNDADTAHADWLVEKLFNKLMKWIESTQNDKKTIQSLSLIKIDEYCLTYNRLKETYGGKLVQEWPKKSATDPQKYVFEDIAIASYLICLWKNYTDVNFVDLGCGNGLLVYLLSQEGYKGYGIDVRRRSTWDIYPVTTKLEVGTVAPHSVFPDCSWLIGNHSDELTPWIPVMAINSSPNTNFFVLPCCPYDFNGKKFIRTNTSISAYADYLVYIEDVCNKCGFQINIDKLRIPSTKRTCLIGTRKKLDPKEHEKLVSNILKFVKIKMSNEFVQRSDTEKVRNCTQLNKAVVNDIVKICVHKLLSRENFAKKSSGDLWNRGCSFKISELVSAIPKESLKQLKQECGGLQTLLRNHRYIFETENGMVSLRMPISIKETSNYKEKPCWFSTNHPNGCFYDQMKCGYSHRELT